jgi:P-type conjugative transfer protein TrbG
MKKVHVFAMLIVMAVIFGSCQTNKAAELSNDQIQAYMDMQNEVVFGAMEDNAASTGQPEQLQPQAPIDVPVVEFYVEEESQEQVEEENPVQGLYNNTLAYTVEPSRQQYSGGAVVYNYVPNSLYKLYVAPFQITDIVLEEGEELTSDPVAGNTVNFVLHVGTSQSAGRTVTHVYVRPQFAGYTTTLMLNTNKRTYRFSVRSLDTTFMPIVSFNYPLDSVVALQQDVQRRAESELRLNVPIEKLDMNYEIIPMSVHRPHWMPSSVFSDTENNRTYISFASASRAAYAPILVAVEGRNSRRLLTYRVVGTWYVVDEVIQTAQLILDVNNGNIITIQRIDY